MHVGPLSLVRSKYGSTIKRARWCKFRLCKLMTRCVQLRLGFHGHCNDARTRCLTSAKKPSLRWLSLTWHGRAILDLSPRPRDGGCFYKEPHLGSTRIALVTFKACGSTQIASVSYRAMRTSSTGPWPRHLRFHTKCTCLVPSRCIATVIVPGGELRRNIDLVGANAEVNLE